MPFLSMLIGGVCNSKPSLKAVLIYANLDFIQNGFFEGINK